MYDQLQTYVKIGNNISEFYKCGKGTRQGCVMSPTLFKLYLNDLPNILKSRVYDPVMVCEVPVNCLLYADDHSVAD